MQKCLLAATAAVVLSTPAVARETGPYVGIEGGVFFPKAKRATYTATFTQSAQTPAAGTAAAAPGTGNVGMLPSALTTPLGTIVGGSTVRFKRGYDVDAIAGYRFGMFRVEGELGYKRSKLKSFSVDNAFGAGVTSALVAAGTTAATGTTAFTFPAGNATAFNLRNHVSVLSGMVNGLFDFGIGNSASVYAGAGVGRARFKAFGYSASTWAWQGIAGVSFPISPNVDLGLKYRYFRTGNANLRAGTVFSSQVVAAVPNVPATAGGNATGTTNVGFTRTAAVNGAFNGHFSSNSLLLSLTYNFGSVAAPPPPAPPPPPPPAAPATQTCPDGTVIEATATCPAPPPPPPPPPPPAPAQRGERG